MKHTLLSKPILHKLFYIALASALLTAIFLLTDPERVSLALLLVPFLLIGFVVYQTSQLLLDLSRTMRQKNTIKKLIGLSFAFGIVALLLLASLGQLTVRDGLLVVGFVLVFLFYMARADFLDDRNRS